jgi:hypothetical protein
MSSDSTRDRAIDHLLSTSPAADGSTPDCVDAEHLAAWAEGALSAAEQQSVESHLASCVRCQAMAAAFARATLEIRPAPVLVFWKRPVVRWAVPLAAAAALVAAVWLREPGAPTAIGTQARVEPGTGAPTDERAGETTPADTSAREQQAFRANDQQVSAPRPPAAASPPAPAAAPTAAAAQPRAAEAVQPSRIESRVVSSVPPDAMSVVVRTPDGIARWQIQDGAIARSALGSTAPEDAAAEPSAVAGNAADRARAGQVEADAASSTWTTVTVDPPAMFLAGAAPSPNVAWFVGRRGVVVRTSNGTAFSRIAFPEMTDLTAVEATSAERAVVTTAGGRRYATADAGLTWTVQ